MIAKYDIRLNLANELWEVVDTNRVVRCLEDAIAVASFDSREGAESWASELNRLYYNEKLRRKV